MGRAGAQGSRMGQWAAGCRAFARRPGRGGAFVLFLAALALSCVCAIPSAAAGKHGCGAGHHARHRASASRARGHGGGCLKVAVRVQGQPGAAGSPTSFALGAKPKGAKISGYTISFGDGAKSKGTRHLPKSVQHVYRAAGRYTATLTVKGASKASARVTVTVPSAAPRAATPPPAGSGSNASAPKYDPAF